jgi:hypothetical protein
MRACGQVSPVARHVRQLLLPDTDTDEEAVSVDDLCSSDDG